MSAGVCPACQQPAEPGDLECSLCVRDLGSLAARAERRDAPTSVLPPARGDAAWQAERPAQPPRWEEEPALYREHRPSPEPRRSAALVLVAVVVAVIVTAAGAVALLRGSGTPAGAVGSGTTSNASAPQPTVTTPDPSPASPSPESSPPVSDSSGTSGAGYPPVVIAGQECGRLGEGPHAAAAAGNDHTSCPFALAVRNAYVASGADGAPTRLRVFSTVTQRFYAMACAGDQPVTCTGGNDAVVYLYGGEASFR